MFPSIPKPSSWDVVSAFKNLFGGGAQQQQTIGGNPLVSTIPNYPYAGYQVQTNDSFDTIAKANNLTTQQVQQANNGMLVPPPAGRYINLPARATPNQLNVNPPVPPAAPYGPGPSSYNTANQQANNRGANAPVGYGPYWQQQKAQQASQVQAVPMNQAGVPSYGWNSYASQFSNTNATAQPDDVAVGNTLNALQSGQLPQSVSLYAFNNLRDSVTGQKYTHQDMVDSGYSFNPVTGSYVLKNAGVQQANPAGNTDYSKTAAAQQYAASGTAFLDQKRWDPATKKYVKIGDLINQGKLDIHTGQYYPYGRHGGGGGGGGGPVVQSQPGHYGTRKKQLNEQYGGG